MILKEYANAAKYWNNSISEILDTDTEDPWKDIEEALQDYFMTDREAMDNLYGMSEGLMISLEYEINRIQDAPKGQFKSQNDIKTAVMAITGTALLRAFALGVKSQRAYDEIGKLEALLDSN